MITNKFGSEDDYDRGLHVISCLTCKMTQKYYSELGGANFRLSHMGHIVKEGPLPQEEPAPRVIRQKEPAVVAGSVIEAPVVETPMTTAEEFAVAEEAPATEELNEAHPAAKQEGERPTEADTVFQPPQDFPVLLSKLQVDIALREEDRKPSFIVWGLRNGKMDAFILFFPLENTSEVKNLLEKRQYVKQERGEKILFTWARGVVEISDDARAKLYPPMPEVPRPRQMPEVKARPRIEQEPLETRPNVEDEPVEMKRKEPLEMKPKLEQRPSEVHQPPQVARAPVTPPILAEKVAEKPSEAPQASLPPKKEEKEEPLLLAKSSYLQEGEENRREAIRVSKVLRAFRWNVEPAYMIGVILDDNLSIETNTGVISRALIKKIESLGYSLIAVNVTRERPTAWFKKKATLSRPTASDSRLREVERKLAEQTGLLEEERRRFDDERAAWQQRFTLLTKLMGSMGETTPAEEGSTDSSEPEPEPDLSS